MANLSEMGFPWHLSIICCPHASFRSCKYHFCCAHVGGTDLLYNLNLNMIHSLQSALHFSSEKAKHRAVLFYNIRESGLVFDPGGVRWRGSLFVDCPLLEKLQFGLKLHTGPHHWISQLILPYTMLRIDIFFAESWIIHSHSYLSVSAPVEITYYPSTEMFGADGDVQ